MNSDLQHLIELHEEMTVLHAKVLTHLLEVTENMKTRTHYSLQEACDIGFLMREMETLLDDWRKDCKVRKELSGRLIAFEVLSDDRMGDTVRGSLARGKIFMKKMLKPPKKGTVEYDQAMAHFGVPTSVTVEGIVKLDWEKTSEYLTRMMEDGEKALTFLETFELYGTSWTRKKG